MEEMEISLKDVVCLLLTEKPLKEESGYETWFGNAKLWMYVFMENEPKRRKEIVGYFKDNLFEVD